MGERRGRGCLWNDAGGFPGPVMNEIEIKNNSRLEDMLLTAREKRDLRFNE